MDGGNPRRLNVHKELHEWKKARVGQIIFLGLNPYQLVIQHQKVRPEDIHKITQTEQVLLSNMYNNNAKETMNLKESGKGYMGGFQRRKNIKRKKKTVIH